MRLGMLGTRCAREALGQKGCAPTNCKRAMIVQVARPTLTHKLVADQFHWPLQGLALGATRSATPVMASARLILNGG